MLTKSIRWRLLLWQGFLLLVLLSGFGVTAFQLHRENRIRDFDSELLRRLTALASDVRGVPPFLGKPGEPPFDPGKGMPEFRGSGPGPGPGHGPEPPDMRKPGFGQGPHGRGPRSGPMDFSDFLEKRPIHLSQATAGLFSEYDTNPFYYFVWSRQGTLMLQATNRPVSLERPPVAPLNRGVQVRMNGTSREAFLVTEIGECVLVGRSMVDDLTALRRFAWTLAAIGSAVLLAGLGGGWMLAGRALTPVSRISATATRISGGNLSERIDLHETDSELGKLAAVLNSTFSRLENTFVNYKQFTADAAHELRTPLAIIISEAQSTLARERDATGYREALETCLGAAHEMKQLTQSLLDLATLDAGQASLKRQMFDLGALVESAVDKFGTLARDKGIQMQTRVEPLEIDGDPDRLARVLTNLLANAVQYNVQGGTITVAMTKQGSEAEIAVADTGIGIAAGELPRIFERFYRTDKARTVSKRHTGLGLAIVKAIVEAHNGTVSVESEIGRGTTFKVRLPITR